MLRDARDARTFCECVGRPLPLLETRRIALLKLELFGHARRIAAAQLDVAHRAVAQTTTLEIRLTMLAHRVHSLCFFYAFKIVD